MCCVCVVLCCVVCVCCVVCMCCVVCVNVCVHICTVASHTSHVHQHQLENILYSHYLL